MDKHLDAGSQTIVYYLELKNELRQSGSTPEFGTENHEAEMLFGRQKDALGAHQGSKL